MALFPQAFIDELRLAADIVTVVQETVTLRRMGTTYKGLCPFHNEKTPSFNVNRERGFFHCFGCGVGGDVFKFVELRDRVSFTEAVRALADRFGLRVPETRDENRDPREDAEREALLKAHEVASAWFREQLASGAGLRGRDELEKRGVTVETQSALGLGYAPSYREGLKTRLAAQGFPLPLLVRSGLVVQRDNGEVVDRFRNRLMIPISRESGPVVAFGGRAMLPDQVPKYLNSPETPIYSKSRTLYGLNLSRNGIRKAGFAVLVEGYFDFAQVWQGGFDAVVATCGTALTVHQAQTLRRFASRVVLSFDPDSAGQGAAARSCELLVAEGFDVSVALLPQGQDPDTFVRRAGVGAYREAIAGARSYLDFLLDRTAAEHDFGNPESRRAFVTRMLEVAARIPEATARDQFADRLAVKARIGEDVIRDEIRKAAVARRTTVPTRIVSERLQLKPAERQLLAALMIQPADATRAIAELDPDDIRGLASERILIAAMDLGTGAPEAVPGLLLARLSEKEGQVLTALASRVSQEFKGQLPAAPRVCVQALKGLRLERERARIQREIDELVERGPAATTELDALLRRKSEVLSRLSALDA